MRQRLVADWLDKANERSYQGAFCLLLAAQGFRIVHNTRHSPIELGKDIVAISPDNVLHAFQLKGDPGGRLTVKGWASLVPQVTMLCTHPWPKDEFDRAVAFQPVLVTNGEVEEETRVAVDQFNNQTTFSGGKTRPLQIWERGRLQAGFGELWGPCWPEGNDAIRMLLEALASDGKNLPDFARISEFLDVIFPALSDVGRLQRERNALSSASIVELYLSSALSANNHYLIIATRHLLRLKLRAVFHEPEDLPISVQQAVTELRALICRSISELQLEAQEKLKDGVFVDGPPLTDFVNYDFRACLVLSLCSALELEKLRAGAERDDCTDWLLQQIKQNKRALLWGEAAVPQLLTMYWFTWKRSADMTAESLLLGLMSALIARQTSDNPRANLMLPHYSIEEVLERDYGEFVETRTWEHSRDEFHCRSQFAMTAAYLAARRNWKKHLQVAWPDLSKIGAAYVRPDNYNAFCSFVTEEAEDASFYPPSTKDWQDLLADADVAFPDNLRGPLTSDAFDLNLHLILFPHRAIPEAVVELDRLYIGPPFLKS